MFTLTGVCVYAGCCNRVGYVQRQLHGKVFGGTIIILVAAVQVGLVGLSTKRKSACGPTDLSGLSLVEQANNI